MSATSLVPRAVESRGGHHQDRGVEEQREHQRDRRVEHREADRLAAAAEVVLVLAGLHDRRVQVEVVRHDRRAEDADRDVEHVGVAHDLGARDEARRRRPRGRAARARARRANDPAISDDQQHDQRLDVAEAGAAAATARAARRADVRHTPQISGSPNSRFSAIAEPITSARSHAAIAISHSIHRTIAVPARVAVAAGLRQVAAAGDPEPRRQRLQQDRHQVREHDDAEQRVAVLRAAGEVGRPIPGVHVADGDQVARPGEGEQFPPEAAAVGTGDRAVDFRQAEGTRWLTPTHGAVPYTTRKRLLKR